MLGPRLVQHNFCRVTNRTELLLRYISANTRVLTDRLEFILKLKGVRTRAGGRWALELKKDWPFIQTQMKLAMDPGEYYVAKHLLASMDCDFLDLLAKSGDDEPKIEAIPMPYPVSKDADEK